VKILGIFLNVRFSLKRTLEPAKSTKIKVRFRPLADVCEGQKIPHFGLEIIKVVTKFQSCGFRPDIISISVGVSMLGQRNGDGHVAFASYFVCVLFNRCIYRRLHDYVAGLFRHIKRRRIEQLG